MQPPDLLQILSAPGFFTGAALLFGLIIGSFLNVVIYRLPLMLEREWRRECMEYQAALLPVEEFSTPEPEVAVSESGHGEMLVEGEEAAYALTENLSKFEEAGEEIGEETDEEAGNIDDENNDGEEEEEPFNLAVPRSRCPRCGHRLDALENIPILSYLLQGGKCKACRAPISIRYPLVEGISSLLAGVAAWHFGFGLPAIAAMILLWSLLALALIDADTQLLPDCITLPLLWLGLFFNLSGGFVPLADAVIGAMAGYLFLWSIYWLFRLVTGKEGMGYGDFKLLAALGAWMGWMVLPFILLFSSLIGAIVGVSLILVAKHERHQPMPFGPYLASAGVVSLFCGADLYRFYLVAF